MSNSSFGDFIRARRRQLGLTQRQLADGLGLKSTAFLSDIEHGNRKPARDLLPALARILQVETAELESHDIRSLITLVRALLNQHPSKTTALRRALEACRDLGPDEVLRRIDAAPAASTQSGPKRRPRPESPTLNL